MTRGSALHETIAQKNHLDWRGGAHRPSGSRAHDPNVASPVAPAEIIHDLDRKTPVDQPGQGIGRPRHLKKGAVGRDRRRPPVLGISRQAAQV
jgi:hypothetical protein